MERVEREIVQQALKKLKRKGDIDSEKLEAMFNAFTVSPAPFAYERLLAKIKQDALSSRKSSFIIPIFFRKPLVVSTICALVIAAFGIYFSFIHLSTNEVASVPGLEEITRTDNLKENITVQRIGHTGVQPKVLTSRQELEKWALAKNAALVAYVDSDNLIVSISKKGTVDALFSSGKTWSFELGSPVTAPLVWGKIAIFCATADSRISALSKNSGNLLWSRRIDGRLLFGGGMIYHDGMLFAGTSTGAMYAFDAFGEEKWSRKFDSGIFVPPVAAGHDLVVATNDGKLTQLKMHDGSIVASASPGRIAGMAAGKEGKLYLSVENGNFICYDYEKKRESWRYSTNTRLAQNPIVRNNGIYLFSSSGEVHFLNFDGRPVWKAALGGTINVHPAIRQGDLYVLAGKALYVLDAKDGGVKWSYVMDSLATTSAVIAEGNIIYGTQSDGMVVLKRN